MNAVGILGYLLTVVGATSNPSEPPTSPTQRTIEILIAGPEDARNRIEATIHPLLGTAPDLRWVTQASLPTDDPLQGSNERGAAQIWIDVSNRAQLRVYLPQNTKGGTTVRTLASAGGGPQEVDPMTGETVAQIVKASVLALREVPAQPAEAADVPVVEKPPVSSWQGAHVHDGLYLRIQSGLGYLRTTEAYGGTDVFSGVGATLNAAVGFSIVGNLILYAEVVTTTVRNANRVSNGRAMEFGPAESGRDLTLLGVGPGATYYLPSNLYAAGTLTISKLWFLNANTDNPPPDTDWGLGGSVAVGKEWWCSRDWGIGVAAQFSAAAMTHHLMIRPTKEFEYVSPTVSAKTFALLFSATYN